MCMEPVESKPYNIDYGIEIIDDENGMRSANMTPDPMRNLCRFITPLQQKIDRHAQKTGHTDIEIIENPYELNPQRHGNIISMMITLYGIAMKSDKGFAMEQFAQSFQISRQSYRVAIPAAAGRRPDKRIEKDGNRMKPFRDA